MMVVVASNVSIRCTMTKTKRNVQQFLLTAKTSTNHQAFVYNVKKDTILLKM
jgi:hypothetical protein